MENGFVAIANFDGVDFFVGAYSVRKTRRKPIEWVMKMASKQIKFWFWEEWGLKIVLRYTLRVIPQAELSEMPPLLCMAEEVFKKHFAQGNNNDNITH